MACSRDGSERGLPRLESALGMATDGHLLCARATDGSAHCAQLGLDGAETTADVRMQRVEGAVGVSQVAVAAGRACFLGHDRRVRCGAFGERAARVTGVEGVTHLVASAAAFFARTRDGHLAWWSAGGSGAGEVRAFVPAITDARVVAARGERVCVSRGEASRLTCWRSAAFGSADAAERGAAGSTREWVYASEVRDVRVLGLMNDGGCALTGSALICWGPEAPVTVGPVPASGAVRCGARHCCVSSPGSVTACLGQPPLDPNTEPPAPHQDERWVLWPLESRAAAGVEHAAGP
ncbi:MAG: hypothetical protein AB8I08_25450 [Sandaracinaceae bacterium]